MRNLTYIDSDVIVNDVKNRMSGYFASNKVDESIFPRVIRKCVGYMGLKVYPEKKTVIAVSNFKARLPYDFKKLTLVVSCHSGSTYLPDPRRVNTEERVVCEADLTACDYNVCKDDCGNMFKVIQTIDMIQYEYSNFQVLKPSKSSYPYCAKDCFNLKSGCPSEFELKEVNGRMELTTNFCDGLLYVEYFGDLEQETGFQIPDNEKVKDWLFSELRREVYAYLYDNGEEVQYKLQSADQEVYIKHEIAKEIYTRSEVSDFYNTANRLARRYNAMSNWINPRTYYYQPK